MRRSHYDRTKVRRAMLVAPAAALLGIVPYFFLLELTLVQLLLAATASAIGCYIAGALFGAPGYLILRALGHTEPIYLVSYAILVVLVFAFLFRDIYVLVSLGPPILLAAGAFCLIRGPAVETTGVDPLPAQ